MRKKFLVSAVILMVFSLINPILTQAAYQVRPNFNPLVSTTAPDFFVNIRKMETSEGPMGLTMSPSNIYTGGDGNGIDVHMMKNTEWGAVAMLAISGYGAGSQSSANSSGYTTGNYTGVYGMGNNSNWEYMATFTTKDGTTVNTKNQDGSTNNYVKTLVDNGIASKYYDLYDIDGITTYNQYDKFYARNYSGATGYAGTKNFKGDAIFETRNLFLTAFPSGYRNHVSASNPFFVRGGSGGGGVLASAYGSGGANSLIASRAVVVCGAGL